MDPQFRGVHDVRRRTVGWTNIWYVGTPKSTHLKGKESGKPFDRSSSDSSVFPKHALRASPLVSPSSSIILLYLPCPPSKLTIFLFPYILDNYGPRSLLLTGTFFHVFGLMMASISTTYYQFLLSQGVCSALGASMIFYPSMSAVVTWFFRRRALALGITASGSSLGGVIFPIMVERLIPQVGFGWTMRICAFLILGLMVVANLTIVSRIPPRPTPVRPKDFVVPFKEVSFSLLALGSFLTFLGM